MPQGNCYLSIIPAFPSRPHPHSHSGQHFGVCACVPLAYCRRVSFAISQYSGILAVNSQVHTPAISYFRPSISRRPFHISHLPSPICNPQKTQSPAACCYCCSFPPHSLGSLNGPNQTQWLCQRQAVGAQALGT